MSSHIGGSPGIARLYVGRPIASAASTAPFLAANAHPPAIPTAAAALTAALVAAAAALSVAVTHLAGRPPASPSLTPSRLAPPPRSRRPARQKQRGQSRHRPALARAAASRFALAAAFCPHRRVAAAVAAARRVVRLCAPSRASARSLSRLGVRCLPSVGVASVVRYEPRPARGDIADALKCDDDVSSNF